jgi:hypothetical protein
MNIIIVIKQVNKKSPPGSYHEGFNILPAASYRFEPYCLSQLLSEAQMDRKPTAPSALRGLTGVQQRVSFPVENRQTALNNTPYNLIINHIVPMNENVSKIDDSTMIAY